MNTQLKSIVSKPIAMHRSNSLRIAAAIALVFGLLTIASGGRALFGDEAARAAVGDAVPFVLWFNFIAGFAYVVAAVGLWRGSRWCVGLSVLIAASTIFVFVALGVFVTSGGAYESRTVGAMALRSIVWLAISVLAWRSLRKSQT